MGKDRLAYVDSLRAIAALLVVMLHTLETFVALPGGSASSWLAGGARAINLGHIGVVLFFAISGFVIPATLRGERATATRSFVIRRFFRLFPAYWVSIALALLLGEVVGRQFSVGEILANVTMLGGFFGIDDLIGLYWTLRVELVFYALCLLLFHTGVLGRPAWIIAAAYAGGALYLLGTWSKPEFALPPLATHLPTNCLNVAIMFWGAWMRSRHDGAAMTAATRWLGMLFGLGLVVAAPALGTLLTMLHLGPGTRPQALLHFVAPYAIAPALFVLGITVARIRWRALAWIGEISYSLYLFHPLVFATVFWQVRRAGPGVLGDLPLMAWVVAISVLSIGVAALVYHGVERPAIRLGRRLTRSGSAAQRPQR